jgi:hypothetical protein
VCFYVCVSVCFFLCPSFYFSTWVHLLSHHLIASDMFHCKSQQVKWNFFCARLTQNVN